MDENKKLGNQISQKHEENDGLMPVPLVSDASGIADITDDKGWS